jgi:hypothetical protein
MLGAPSKLRISEIPCSKSFQSMRIRTTNTGDSRQVISSAASPGNFQAELASSPWRNKMRGPQINHLETDASELRRFSLRLTCAGQAGAFAKGDYENCTGSYGKSSKEREHRSSRIENLRWGTGWRGKHEYHLPWRARDTGMCRVPRLLERKT